MKMLTTECNGCGGSGFSGRGTGYGDVCGDCGGNGEHPVHVGKIPHRALQEKDIVRVRKHRDKVIPYRIESIEGVEAKCTNLLDAYKYVIPVDDLYVWIVD